MCCTLALNMCVSRMENDHFGVIFSFPLHLFLFSNYCNCNGPIPGVLKGHFDCVLNICYDWVTGRDVNVLALSPLLSHANSS